MEHTYKIRFPKRGGRNFLKFKETATENTINPLISVAFYFLKDFIIHTGYGFRVSEIYSKYVCVKCSLALFSVSVIHEEKFASRAPLPLTNAQKYRHAKYACLILACLYALVPNLFFVNYWNREKMNNEYLTTNLSF